MSKTSLQTIRTRLIQDGARQQNWEGYEGWIIAQPEGSIRIILPTTLAAEAPWFWRPEFFGAFATVDLALLRQGWVLCFLDLPDHYGCPTAITAFCGMHRYATDALGLSPRCGIVALSRAGLSAYHFASAFPEKTLAIYADNPVCDFRSWPGGIGTGPGNAEDWRKLLAVYGLSDAQARAYEQQPWACLQPIVNAGIPLLHVCGDSDETVPYEENTLLLKEHLQRLGGTLDLITIPGRGHHPHGLDDPTTLVTFFNRAHEQACKAQGV